MIAIYEELRDDPTANTNPADQYNATRKDNTAHDVLGHIASYFVMSNTDEYPVNNVKNFQIGTLKAHNASVRSSRYSAWTTFLPPITRWTASTRSAAMNSPPSWDRWLAGGPKP